MKKVVFTNQLDLGKEIIANLTEEQLQEIEGGVGADGSCTSGNGSCVIIVVTTTEAQSTED